MKNRRNCVNWRRDIVKRAANCEQLRRQTTASDWHLQDVNALDAFKHAIERGDLKETKHVRSRRNIAKLDVN
jgi:hypothetical protein